MSELKIDPEIPNLKEEVKRVLAEKVDVDNFDLYISIRFKHQQFSRTNYVRRLRRFCMNLKVPANQMMIAMRKDLDVDAGG